MWHLHWLLISHRKNFKMISLQCEDNNYCDITSCIQRSIYDLTKNLRKDLGNTFKKKKIWWIENSMRLTLNMELLCHIYTVVQIDINFLWQQDDKALNVEFQCLELHIWSFIRKTCGCYTIYLVLGRWRYFSGQ